MSDGQQLTKEHFEEYVMYGRASHEMLQKFLEVEQKVREQNVDDAMKSVDDIFFITSPPPINGKELEYLSHICSPVRASLFYALAAQEREALEETEKKNMDSGYCIYKVFLLIKAIREIRIDEPVNSVSQFLVKMIIRAYEKGFGNPQSRLYSEISRSGFAANYVALSCHFIGDHALGAKFCQHGIDLLKGSEHYDKLAYLYNTAGRCYLGMDELVKAKQHLDEGVRVAQCLPDTIPNSAKAKVQNLLRTSLSKLRTNA